MAKKTPAVTVSLRYCAARFPKPPKVSRDVSPDRMRLILQTTDKWLNGSKIRYWFFDGPKKWVGAKDQQDVVRKAFAMWKSLGVGLDFEEVLARKDADVRIAFEQDDGSWS